MRLTMVVISQESGITIMLIYILIAIVLTICVGYV